MAKTLDQLVVRFTRLADGAVPNVTAALERASLLLVGYIKTEKLSGDPINRRTGNLSSHISHELSASGTQITSRVGVIRGVPYARPLEEGSRPHVIRARAGGVLAFKGSDGGMVFRASVKHPGNRAFRFLRGSLNENRAKITEILRAAQTGYTKAGIQ